MQKLYLDCDGVILDTISFTYKIIKERGISEDKVDDFFKNLCWDNLIEEAGEIDNAINKIKELSKHFDVKILTHVNSEQEIRAKFKYFSKVLPDIKLNIVPKIIRKGDIVDPKGAILVDDFSSNLEYWEEMGGISVKFSDSNKESRFIKITDLLDLLTIDFTSKIKVKE